MVVHNSYLIASNDDECLIFCDVMFFFTLFLYMNTNNSFDKLHIS